MSRLERFKVAQDQHQSGYESALAEMQAGGKQGHWIRYIFPQLSGLGRSGAAQTYAIEDPGEAEGYLQDPVLCSRLLKITETVAEQVRPGTGLSLEWLMGSSIDAMKVVSSLTLFGHIAKRLYASQGHHDHAALSRAADAGTWRWPPPRATRRASTRWIACGQHRGNTTRGGGHWSCV